MLLDSASLYFRAYFGVPDTFVSPDGRPVNAVRGFLDFVARLVTDHRPGRLVACWDDDWRPDFRVRAIPSYKAHRVADPSTDAEEVPDALADQVPVIEAVLAALGVPRVGVPGHEADDVIGTLATREPGRVDVVTGDRDLFQLVDDERDVRIVYTARSVAKAEIVDRGRRRAPLRHPRALLRGVRGASGGPQRRPARRPGGRGEDGGRRWCGPTGTSRGWWRPRRTRGSRWGRRCGPRCCRRATTSRWPRWWSRWSRDLPVPVLADAIPAAPADPEALVALVDRWGLDSPVGRVLAAFARATG